MLVVSLPDRCIEVTLSMGGSNRIEEADEDCPSEEDGLWYFGSWNARERYSKKIDRGVLSAQMSVPCSELYQGQVLLRRADTLTSLW